MECVTLATVGDDGVGKASIVERYFFDAFSSSHRGNSLSTVWQFRISTAFIEQSFFVKKVFDREHTKPSHCLSNTLGMKISLLEEPPNLLTFTQMIKLPRV